MEMREAVIDAMLREVSFAGWSKESFERALKEVNVSKTAGYALFPTGEKGVAIAFHRRSDAALSAAFCALAQPPVRVREKIETAIMLRLELVGEVREAIRASAIFFGLPQNSFNGARLIWETADQIWRVIGDRSEDLSWYTKRATLAGVYSATLLYWLGDESNDFALTREFLKRRIDEVMLFEKVKSNARKIPFLRNVEIWANDFAQGCRRKSGARFKDVPGSLGRQE